MKTTRTTETAVDVDGQFTIRVINTGDLDTALVVLEPTSSARVYGHTGVTFHRKNLEEFIAALRGAV